MFLFTKYAETIFVQCIGTNLWVRNWIRSEYEKKIKFQQNKTKMIYLQEQCNCCDNTNEMKTFFEFNRSRILTTGIDYKPPTDGKLRTTKIFEKILFNFISTTIPARMETPVFRRSLNIEQWISNWLKTRIRSLFVRFNPIKWVLTPSALVYWEVILSKTS